jgi:uncharacterized damage-inducible protein DinB
MHHRLIELVEFVEGQRTALLDAAAAVPADRWSERPAPGRWSVAEVCEHLYLVEHGCARVIAKRAMEARDADHLEEAETSSVLGSLDGHGIADRGTPLQVPSRLAPTGTWTAERALEALARSRLELLDAIRAADGLALGRVRSEHARLGEIDLYQWILFVGQHEARHRSQLEEVAEQLAAASS